MFAPNAIIMLGTVLLVPTASSARVCRLVIMLHSLHSFSPYVIIIGRNTCTLRCLSLLYLFAFCCFFFHLCTSCNGPGCNPLFCSGCVAFQIAIIVPSQSTGIVSFCHLAYTTYTSNAIHHYHTEYTASSYTYGYSVLCTKDFDDSPQWSTQPKACKLSHTHTGTLFYC